MVSDSWVVTYKRAVTRVGSLLTPTADTNRIG